MKIKKKANGEGGAAIADRFKLEPAGAPAKKGGDAKGTIGKIPSLIALVFGLIGLTLVGSLAFMLFVHWDFLIPA